MSAVIDSQLNWPVHFGKWHLSGWLLCAPCERSS